MASLTSMRIGLLGATLETQNLGVSALAAGAIQCILSAYPQASVFFLDYGRESTLRTVQAGGRRVAVPLVNMRFSKKIWLPNNIAVLLLAALLLKMIPFARVRDGIAGRNRCLREIEATDLFASVAGGDSFSDIYGLARFIYSALPQILILLLGKRLVLLPQTYGPFRRTSTRTVARWIVSRADRAWSRDDRSLAQLMDGSKAAVSSSELGTFCYDMAFGIDSTRPDGLVIEGLSLKPQRDRMTAGVNISGLLFRGGYTGKNEFGLRENYRELIRAVIEALLLAEETSVLLVPHVFGLDSGTESDVVACEEVFSELRNRYPGRIGIVRGCYDPHEIRFVIGLCGFFVGSRMHACIAAVSQNIPAVAIAYSDKFIGVMETVGSGALVADARKLSRAQILAMVDNAFSQRELLGRELQKAIPPIRAAVRNLLTRPVASSRVLEPNGVSG
jgi:colanic acid/amylovoran biosynthesis protein